MTDVEKVAREMVVAFGHDPDQLVPATGYSDAEMIPRWRQEWEYAVRAITAHRILKTI